MNEIKKQQVEDTLKQQRAFFDTAQTKEAEFRIRQLKRLKAGMKQREGELLQALKQDLGKHENEGFMTEVGFVYKSIQSAIKNLKQWMEPKRVKTPSYMMPAKSYIRPEPYGSVLIIGPFNYPVQLVIEPLLGAIAAGNCVVVKLSELTPNVSRVLSELIGDLFPKKYIWCVEGGVPTTTALLEENFDYIFFTGSPAVGKIVMQAAANHMTPVTLELGGKSPVIVDETADIKTAAQRIVWGKTLNVGQTCVAPDYIYVHESVKQTFIDEMVQSYHKFYGEDAHKSESYARIVNDRHLNRLHRILKEEKDHIIFGGTIVPEERYMEFTMIDVTSREQACMQEEIFGPILPIITYHQLDEVIKEINRQPKPLALYLFSRKKLTQQKVLNETASGGVCINDVISHIINPHLPFGGVGNSGIGSYHGKDTFDTFSHRKSVLHNQGGLSSLLTQPPYSKMQLEILRKVFR